MTSRMIIKMKVDTSFPEEVAIRQITILSTIFKVFEIIVLNRFEKLLSID
jgi:hypothetical protein